MKNKLLIAFCCCLNIHVSAQQTGLFLSLSDYQQHKLSYEMNCSDVKRYIRLHDSFYDRPSISILYQGRKINFSKDSIYGYQACDNYTYRLYHHAAFRIEEAGNIIIYSQEEYVSRYKKRCLVVLHYYFSTHAGSEILPLTIRQLKTAYSNYPKFIDLLDLYFQTDGLTAYDDVHKMYRLNYLFIKAE